MTIEQQETYLGDGVYAEFDGYHIWLKTNREDGQHRIALEPSVFVALVGYQQKLVSDMSKASSQ